MSGPGGNPVEGGVVASRPPLQVKRNAKAEMIFKVETIFKIVNDSGVATPILLEKVTKAHSVHGDGTQPQGEGI